MPPLEAEVARLNEAQGPTSKGRARSEVALALVVHIRQRARRLGGRPNTKLGYDSQWEEWDGSRYCCRYGTGTAVRGR